MNKEKVKKIIEEELSKAVDNIIKRLYQEERKEWKYVAIRIKYHGIKYDLYISPTKNKDKIVVHLYRKGKRLNVIGEIMTKDGEIVFQPYIQYIERIALKEKLDVKEFIDIVKKEIDKKIIEIGDLINETGVNVRDIDPSILAYKVSMVEDEMMNILEGSDKDYITDEELEELLNKYGIDMETFRMFVRGFYEREKGKWYPI